MLQFFFASCLLLLLHIIFISALLKQCSGARVRFSDVLVVPRCEAIFPAYKVSQGVYRFCLLICLCICIGTRPSIFLVSALRSVTTRDNGFILCIHLLLHCGEDKQTPVNHT